MEYYTVGRVIQNKKHTTLKLPKKVWLNFENEAQLFPLYYSIPNNEQYFFLEQLKNRSEQDIWALIKRFCLEESLFKGRFIGLRKDNESKILLISEFKAIIDQIDDELKEDLHFYIVKEKFDNVFSSIESKLEQLMPLNINEFAIYSLSNDAAFTSSVIEGNRTTKEEFEISESEEEDVIAPENKEIRELRRMHQQLQMNIIKGGVFTISKELLLEEHKQMAVLLKDDAGKFRTVNVCIQGSGHKFPHHSQVIEKLEERLTIFQKKITTAKSLEDRIRAAVFLHYEIVNVHPFRDYNGRMARYMMNMVLFQYCGIPPVSILPGIKEEYFASIREIDKNSNFEYLTTIITQSIIRSLDKALYYNNVLDGMGSLLKDFSLEMLVDICKCNEIPCYTHSKPETINIILRYSRRAGEVAFFLELEESDLRELVQDPSLSFDNLRKNVGDELFSNEYSKMIEFLESCNEKLLDRFLSLLSKNNDSSKEEKIKALLEEMLILGMGIVFIKMKEDTISWLCNELKQQVNRSKFEKICSIIGTAYPRYADISNLSLDNDIKKDITLEKLSEYHYLELVNYLEQNNLEIRAKTKKDICKSIITHLNNSNPLKRSYDEISKDNTKSE